MDVEASPTAAEVRPELLGAITGGGTPIYLYIYIQNDGGSSWSGVPVAAVLCICLTAFLFALIALLCIRKLLQVSCYGSKQHEKTFPPSLL